MRLVAQLVLAFALASCSTGPTVGHATDGAFALAIAASSSTYTAGEAIPVTASLTYTGTGTVRISHALQPIAFGVDGFLDGDVHPIFAFKCASSELHAGQPLTVPFAKTGGTVTPNPSFDAFMSDPLLRLPAGVWHVYALASFSESSCGAPGHDIRADIVITVTARAGGSGVLLGPTAHK